LSAKELDESNLSASNFGSIPMETNKFYKVKLHEYAKKGDAQDARGQMLVGKPFIHSAAQLCLT
jgi:hypothetical protein